MNPPLIAAALAALLSAAPSTTAGAPAAGLTLPEALAELDRQSPSLAEARARADEADALSRQALAGLLPGLTATATWLRNSDDAVIDLKRINPALPGPIEMQPLHSLSGALSLRVPVVAAQAWFEHAAARDGARSAAAGVEAARLGLRSSLVVAVHLSAAAEEAVAATERALANAAALAESAERKVKAGTAPPLDALRARTEQVKRESDLVRARADLERGRLALGVLLGRDGPVRVVAPPPPAPLAPGDDAALVAEARAHRPELVAAAARVDGAEAQVRAAWARLVPQVSGNATTFAADVPYPTQEKQGWRVSLDLTWPLYDGGLRYGKRREAEARLAQARAGAEAQRLQVGEEARDAARDEAVAAERLRLAGEQRRLADDAAATARRGYEAGVASSLDVLDANDRLYAADVGLADARARLAAARAGHDRALGRDPR